MDDSSSGALPQRKWLKIIPVGLVYLGLAFLTMAALEAQQETPPAAVERAAEPVATPAAPTPWNDIFPPHIILFTAVLICFSAFFSASEVAFFSLHRLRLRSMRESGRYLPELAARLMEHPGSLLTSILMGNSIVNVIISVVLGVRVQQLLHETFLLDPLLSYVLAVIAGTAVLVLLGEIFPKIAVVRQAEGFAAIASAPILVVDVLLTPVRHGLLKFIGYLFRVTRFSELEPAPFMTDAEFRSILTESEVRGVIEKDERQMIEGILEFGEASVREILIPRPDVIALPVAASVGEAVTLLRQYEYARIPVFEDDMDHVRGLLYAKDLLPLVAREAWEEPIRPIMRKAHYVPATMSIANFIKAAQRLHTHMAIVVDEFGGTEGIATLQDAIREVVGDIGGDETDVAPFTVLGEGVYRMPGGYPLDEFEELTGLDLANGEHSTIAGFLMEQTDKILEEGDEIEHAGARFVVEKVLGKRVGQVLVHVPPQTSSDEETEEVEEER